MKKMLIAMALLVNVYSAMAQEVAIIPQPNSLQQTRHSFALSASTPIQLADENFKGAAVFLNGYLQNYYGFSLPVQNAAGNKQSIVFSVQKSLSEGAYELTVANKAIQIKASDAEGARNAVATLLQLLPVAKQQPLTIAGVQVEDAPRFAYRGMHLDVSRHFYSVAQVKKYIDYLAYHKMNYFHWHLTDDQGWRIEIKKYPLLTQIGSKREGTIIGRYPGTGFDNKPYEGFYTQEQIKEVVAYATERSITVLPEIEMPGHSMAVLASYPQLSTTPNIAKKVSTTWGVFDKDNNVLNPSEETFTFLENVLLEVMELFPAKYIHIGGDECSKIWWEQSEFCKNLMKEKNIADAHALQSYFIQRMEKFVNSKGKQIIGWDEILEGGLAPNATVMSWRGVKGGIEAAKQKHDVIMTPGSHCYFDHKQIKNEDSVTIGGYTTTEKVYSFEPVPTELSADEAKYVLGAQGNVWTEYMNNFSKVEYMIFPRMSALSEVLWTQKKQKDYTNFKTRLAVQKQRYQLWGANYFKGNLETEK
jgi:hexosaminidase